MAPHGNAGQAVTPFPHEPTQPVPFRPKDQGGWQCEIPFIVGQLGAGVQTRRSRPLPPSAPRPPARCSRRRRPGRGGPRRPRPWPRPRRAAPPAASAAPARSRPTASIVRRIAPTFCGSSTSSSTTSNGGGSSVAVNASSEPAGAASTSATTPWCTPCARFAIERVARHLAHRDAVRPRLFEQRLQPAVVARAHAQGPDASRLERLEHGMHAVDHHAAHRVVPSPAGEY